MSLPFIDEPILLSVGDRVFIPVEFWKYVAGVVNKRLPVTLPWLLSNLPEDGITGTVRWVGTLPPVGGTQYFAGIETVSIKSGLKDYLPNRFILLIMTFYI